MILAVSLTILLALATFRHWETDSRLASQSPVIDSRYRFFYVSTASRRLLVAGGFCLLALLAAGGGVMAVYATVWQFLSADLGDGWVARFALPCIIVAGIFLGFASPPLRPFVNRLRYFLLRHLFFPVLPSRREEQVIQQLMAGKALEFELENATKRDRAKLSRSPTGEALREAAGEVENEAVDDLVDPGGELETARATAEERARTEENALQLHVGELTRLHGKLRRTVGDRHKLSSRFLFYKEWDVVDSFYRSIHRQMALPARQRHPGLYDKIHLCLYHSYRLMTDYVFLTGLTRKQRLCMFRWFGYRVALPD